MNECDKVDDDKHAAPGTITVSNFGRDSLTEQTPLSVMTQSLT